MWVCVLEILVLKIFKLRDYFKRLLCWLDHWLSCMLDYIHICVFLLSKNCFEKLAWHLLDTLLFVELLKHFSYRNPNSSLIPGGSIELLFLDLIPCCSIPQLSTTIFSIPSSIASSTPLDTCICRDLLRVYIYFLHDPFLISSISLDLSTPVHLPNTLSLSLQTSSFVIFQAFSRFFLSW